MVIISAISGMEGAYLNQVLPNCGKKNQTMKTARDTLVENPILVVDDNDEFRSSVVEHLRNEHFIVLDTPSSSEACKWIREGKASLVLLDWDLQSAKSSAEQSSTGLKILRTCREAHPLLPVVVMSGAPDYDARCDSMMWDADSFLAKPFPLALLTKHLRRWLARAEAEQNPFTQLAIGVIQTADTVNRAYTRAVVEKVGSVLQAAPKLGLSRQTVASYLGSVSPSPILDSPP
jgi:DNA-binding response OmpR family regulator